MDAPQTSTTAIVDPKVQQSFEIIWLLVHAYLMFFMQSGFALIEAGNVRTANAKQVPFKAMLLACLCGIIWFIWGQPMAYGEKGIAANVFVGGNDWAMTDNHSTAPTSYSFWLLQWGMACAVAAIFSGAVAERCRLSSYIFMCIVLVGLMYPVVVHWVWSSEGWLSARRDAGGPLLGGNGLIDEGGSGVLHITAGCAALMGAYFIGPRTGRFHTDGSVLPLKGSSMVLSSVGTMFVWFSWFGLVSGNTWLMTTSYYVGSKVAVSMTLAASAAGLSAVGIMMARRSHLEMQVLMDGIRAGLVAISASAAVVEPYAAVIIGLVAGAVFLGGEAAVLQMQVDDPTNSAAVHLLPGIWGLVAAGLFATKDNLQRAGYLNPPESYGVFYSGDGKQLGIQLLGAASIMLWSTALSAIALFALRYFKLLRLHVSEELTGVQWQVRADWRYNAEAEDVDYDRHQAAPSGKAAGGAVARHTFLPTEGEGYYDEEDMYEDSDEQGEFYGGRSASRSGYGAYGMPAGGSHTSMRHAAGLGRAASGAAEVGLSQLSSTATSDTSQQQASRLGSTTGNLLSLRQPSRLVVQVDARPTSK